MSMTSKLDARERVKDDGRSASFPRQLKPKKKKKTSSLDSVRALCDLCEIKFDEIIEITAKKGSNHF